MEFPDISHGSRTDLTWTSFAERKQALFDLRMNAIRPLATPCWAAAIAPNSPKGRLAVKRATILSTYYRLGI